jgi:glycosyltransferase involved in cell wall biosynthesis
MRILFLCRNSVAKTAGGVVEYLHYLPLALKKQGIEVVMYDMSGDNDTLQGPQVLANGMASYSGPVVKPSWFVSRKKLAPLIEVCRREKIDFVHAQGTYRSGFVALQLFKRTGLPYLVMSHGDIATANSDRMKRGSVQRRCRAILQKALGVLHLTPMMADASHAVFDTRQKSTIIANGIDLSAWQTVANASMQNYMVGIGRLQREKGFHILVDAYAELCRRGVKTSLVIAGDGAEAAALQAQARNLGLNVVTDYQSGQSVPAESVVFTGYIKGHTKYQLIAESQIMLFPTQPSQWEEPFGIVQIEAMAAGKVLVASDSATTRYLQTLGLQAVLAKADDPQAWADQLQPLLRAPERCQALGEMNRQHVQQFDWAEIAEQYAKMYRAL